MNVMAFTMALWTSDVYGDSARSTALDASLHGLFRYIVLLFSLPVYYLLGLPLFEQTIGSLRRGIYSTDLLLASGVAAAFLFSFFSVLRGGGPIYFEVGCIILVMTTLGRWLEATGRLKANAALDAIAKLLPATVVRMVDGSAINFDRPGRAGRPAACLARRAFPGGRPCDEGALLRR